MPLIPIALSRWPAMMPATCVPCPTGSTSVDGSLIRPRTIARPAIRFWFRSGFGPEPESITATVTPLPVDKVQISLAFIALIPHCDSKAGSFDACAIAALKIETDSEEMSATTPKAEKFLLEFFI